MGDIIREGTGEIVGDFDQYISFKSLIEGYFNDLDFHVLVERAEVALRHPLAILDIGMTIISESTSLQGNAAFHDEGFPSTFNAGILSALRKNDFVQRIQNRKHVSTYIKNGDQSFVATSLSINEISSLILLTFEYGNEITHEDMMNIKKASQLLVLALQKEIAFNRVDPHVIHPIMKKLINGSPVSSDDLTATSKNLEWFNDFPCRMLLLQTDTPSALHFYIYSLANFFKQYFSVDRFQLYEDTLIVLIPLSAYEQFMAEEGSLVAFLEYNQMYCVISEPIQDIRTLHYEYRKLRVLLDTCVSSDTHIGMYDRMFFHVISNMIEKECPIEQFCHPAILALREYDTEYGTEFSKTLFCYLEHNDYIEDVLDALFIKKSTLFYRLNKIKEITGLDLKAPNEKLALHLSYKLLHAQKKLF